MQPSYKDDAKLLRDHWHLCCPRCTQLQKNVEKPKTMPSRQANPILILTGTLWDVDFPCTGCLPRDEKTSVSGVATHNLPRPRLSMSQSLYKFAMQRTDLNNKSEGAMSLGFIRAIAGTFFAV